MKKLYATIGLFLASLVSAQIPQAFSYQTIAFNAAGAPIANGNVSLRISILDNAANGTVLYTETQNKTTNAKGLVNLNIGQGTATTGNFGAINWGTNAKFVKVEMDPAGGSNYTNVGVNQLMSVPYAMVADKINMNSNGSSLNDDIVENKFSNFGFIDSYDAKAYVFNSKTGTWVAQTFNTYASPTLVTSNGNFAFIDAYSAKSYAFSSKTGTWISQTFNASASPTLITSNGNFAFMDMYDAKAYVFNSKTGIWTVQAFNPSASPSLVSSNGNFAFMDMYDTKAYAFNTKTGTWITQAFNSSANPSLTKSNGNFAFVDSYSSKAYVFNSKTGTWISQTFNSSANPSLILSESN
ncbi:hypothetical protein [Chryseobacterium sp. EO14]|uniref:hypothetical protein n=1 Tax=Chryseobacterium sp. EO14 TaxID=2950551 RepID=UPI00210B8FF3|nr:hypothetical protein [Chryseobacterium sp. EO14]MCQ4139485.1 hypothetical protein [Chryseobacterium sp. EO14]